MPSIKKFIPLLIGLGISILMYTTTGWWGFGLIFSWIGGSVTLGIVLAARLNGKRKDLGRRTAILMISPIFLIFLGLWQHENLQLEETVFYFALFLNAGIFTRVLIHYAIAKIFGPLIWGRGFCGWACWTAAILDWLPIKKNLPIPQKFTWIRFPVFILSLAIPLLFIYAGYDYTSTHPRGDLGKPDQFIWFLIGNGIYYLVGIILAFVFQKKRAFCKIACPVGLMMKLPTQLARLKKKPSGNRCTGCGLCTESCPMDIPVMDYIKAGKNITSTECILCNMCEYVCPERAIT